MTRTMIALAAGLWPGPRASSRGADAAGGGPGPRGRAAPARGLRPRPAAGLARRPAGRLRRGLPAARPRRGEAVTGCSSLTSPSGRSASSSTGGSRHAGGLVAQLAAGWPSATRPATSPTTRWRSWTPTPGRSTGPVSRGPAPPGRPTAPASPSAPGSTGAGSWVGGVPADGHIGLYDVKARRITPITPPGYNHPRRPHRPERHAGGGPADLVARRPAARVRAVGAVPPGGREGRVPRGLGRRPRRREPPPGARRLDARRPVVARRAPA